MSAMNEDGWTLSGQDQSQKGFAAKPADQEAIDWLSPGSLQHTYVLEYLRDRIKYSEKKMSRFYSRWRVNELQLQAYISLPDYDALLKKTMDEKGSAQPIAINVPFAWATVNTIVTYLLHMFGGRQPIFEVGSYRAEQTKPAQNMETLLQYNSDYTRFIRNLYFFLMDGETYGVAVLRTLWKQEKRNRKVTLPPDPQMAALMATLGAPPPEPERTTQSYVSFEGNGIANVDPYMFFPDPRVPMHEVAEKGEWVSWRAFEGRHTLLGAQAAGSLKWVEKIPDDTRNASSSDNYGASARGMRALGDATAGESSYQGDGRNIKPNIQIDQGTFEIIPKDLGLSDSSVPEKWLFTLGNMGQILQAVPVDLPTGRHPVEVAEPNSFGYSFGQLGTVDMLGPFQNLMSWFMNSHIYNVRAVLNNMLVVDPTKVEMQDLKRPGPGGVIRLKNTAFGLTDPKNAIFQLPIQDVTQGNINDFSIFQRMASDLTGATDNVRGLQDAGGRKTATEIRTSAEAGTSRLAAKGKVYSSMALTGLAEQWALNYQSNMTQEFEFKVLGVKGQSDSVRITPESIYGDFYFPVHDGTLPIDKVGLLDVWRQIFAAVLADPELRQRFSIVDMFTWIAQLGGAQNVESFKINVVPNGQAMDTLAQGQGLPITGPQAVPPPALNPQGPPPMPQQLLNPRSIM